MKRSGMQTRNLDFLERKMIKTERDNLRLNIVASGLNCATPQEGYDALNKVLSEATNNQIQVTGQRAFHSAQGDLRIVAACSNINDKRAIMQVKRNLTITSGGVGKKVFIDHDLPREDRIAQKRLRDMARSETIRNEGKHVVVVAGKIKVDGEWFKLCELTNTLLPTFFRGADQNKYLEHSGAKSQNPTNQQLL